MRRLLPAVMVLALAIPLAAQDLKSLKIYKSKNPGEQGLGQIEFLAALSARDIVTFGDTLNAMVLVLGREPGTFAENKAALKAAGVTEDLELGEDDLVRKGDVALLVADYLKLDDLLLYAIVSTQRTAFRACVAHGVMDYTGSEWDRVSGGELIEVMNKIARRAEKK